MKKKVKLKVSGNSKKQLRRMNLLAGADIDVDFPQPGEQDCFPETEGTPLIAHGPKPGPGTVIASAKVVYIDAQGAVQQVMGTLFDEDDFDPDEQNPDFLDAYEEHKIIEGGAAANWAVVFPTLTANTLPNDSSPMALIVTAVDVNGTTEKVVPFSYSVEA